MPPGKLSMMVCSGGALAEQLVVLLQLGVELLALGDVLVRDDVAAVRGLAV